MRRRIPVVFNGEPGTIAAEQPRRAVTLYPLPVSRSRVFVWFRNLRCIPVRIALAILRRAFRRDPDFRHSWACNIAMPIYDATRTRCCCGGSDAIGHSGLCPRNRSESIPVTIGLANTVADRLMRHLFDA